MPLIQLNRITVAFGGPPVLDEIDLVVEPGERLCLLGRNGAGKSTLLRVLAGEVEPDAGDVLCPSGLRVAFLDQQVPQDLTGTILDVVRSGRGSTPRVRAEDHVARTAISRTGLDPDAPIADLSVGLRRRALLAAALASDPDLLLLDEPTNHLDIDAIAWLEGFLTGLRKTIVFVTHDRAFQRRVSTGILDLDRGILARHDADYDLYIERKRHGLETEARADAVADRKLAQEETWLSSGVRERRKRNQGRVRRVLEMRDTRRARREVPGAVRMEARSAAPSGRLVLDAEGISFSWGDLEVVRGLTMTVQRGDCVGIVGPNGSGKTTLLRLLLGDLPPAGGEIRHGTNLEIGYFDQLHADLDPEATAAENVIDGGQTVQVNGRERHIIGYLGDFLFTPDQVNGPVRMFSGGERNRLLLARLFARPSNVLVLDEPTNDLDVETLEVLEELLAAYDGTVLVVSHDRELLDHVCTDTVVLDGAGGVEVHAGGYTDWRARHEARSRPATAAAKRATAPVKPKARRGPTYAERIELQGLPARIEHLEEKQADLHRRMADPGFFRLGGERIAEAQEHLRLIEDEIAGAYARWEELEAKGE